MSPAGYRERIVRLELLYLSIFIAWTLADADNGRWDANEAKTFFGRYPELFVSDALFALAQMEQETDKAA